MKADPLQIKRGATKQIYFFRGRGLECSGVAVEHD